MSNTINFNANKAHDSSGNLLNAAVATFFDTGTSDAQTVYTNKDLVNGAVTSLTADSAGLFALIYSKDATDLKVVVKTSGGTTLWTVDPAQVFSTGAGASAVAFTPTARNTATDVQAAIVVEDDYIVRLENAVEDITATTGSSIAYVLAVTGITAYSIGDT